MPASKKGKGREFGTSLEEAIFGIFLMSSAADHLMHIATGVTALRPQCVSHFHAFPFPMMPFSAFGVANLTVHLSCPD